MGGYIGRGQPVAAGGNSVETADIIDDAVTNAKIATNAVTGDSIASNAVGNSELSDDAVGVAELSASGTASNSTFLRGDNAWATAGSTSASDLTSGTLPIARIANDAIDSIHYAAGSIDNEHLAANSVDSDNYVDDSIDAAHLANSINTDIATGVTAGTVAAAALPKAGGTMSGNINFGDNNQIRLGASNDLAIYHDGNNSVINEEGNGTLLIQSNGSGVNIQKGTTEIMAVFRTDSSVDLYHDNVLKFVTTSAGIDVTGSISSGSGTAGTPAHNFTTDTNTGMFRISADVLGFSTAGTQAMSISATGKLGVGTNATDAMLQTHSGNAASIVRFATGSNSSASSLRIQGGNASESNIWFGDEDDVDVGKIVYQHPSAYMAFTVAASERMRITSTGTVGIGVTAPDSTGLHVKNSEAWALRAHQTSSSNHGLITQVSGSDGAKYGIAMYDGSNFPFKVMQDGAVTATSFTGSGAGLTSLPTGSVLQVQAVNYQGAYSTASGSWVDVNNFTVDITPSSTSNKVLIQCMIQIATSDWGGIQVMRGTTVMNLGNDTVGNKINSSFGSINTEYIDTQLTVPYNFVFLDSPSTTSMITYKIQVVGRYGTGSGTIYINRPHSWNNDAISGRVTASNMVVTEIAG